MNLLPKIGINRGRTLGCSLLGALVLVAFLTASGNAQQPQKASKTSKPAKSQSKVEAPPEVQLVLEPKAIDILKASCSRLAAAGTMSFTAVVSYESPSRLGPPLVYTTRSEVTLQRPDKLRIITPGDGSASELYYNGKTLTAFSPAENLVAVAEAPPTIDEALKVAFDSAAIYYPFRNMIIADPYKAMSDGLILAFYIGQSQIVGGTTTDMVAFANNNVFLQVWIGAEDKLPRMIRGVYRNDLAHLRHQLEFSNWQLDVVVPADAFASTSAGSANPIPFAHPNPKSMTDANPPAKSKSSKTEGKTK
ncbi:MAG: DUF2092 domain-containing protein [Pseudomonadota bacterium]